MKPAVPGSQKEAQKKAVIMSNAADIRKASKNRKNEGHEKRRDRDAAIKQQAWFATFVNGFKACAAFVTVKVLSTTELCLPPLECEFVQAL